MKTAILYYSKHHGNTKKLIDAIKAVDLEVNLIDVTVVGTVDLSGYDRIGVLQVFTILISQSRLLRLLRTIFRRKTCFYLHTARQRADS